MARVPGMSLLPMANRAIWNVRQRHEWLSTPLKAKRIKKRSRARIGLSDALERKPQRATSSTDNTAS
jgi:hypothetical protein